MISAGTPVSCQRTQCCRVVQDCNKCHLDEGLQLCGVDCGLLLDKLTVTDTNAGQI